MKYAGMPFGMWVLFASSFQKQLTAVLGYDADNLDTISEQELMEFLNFSADYAALTIGKMGAAMASMEEMEQVYGK